MDKRQFARYGKIRGMKNRINKRNRVQCFGHDVAPSRFPKPKSLVFTQPSTPITYPFTFTLLDFRQVSPLKRHALATEGYPGTARVLRGHCRSGRIARRPADPVTASGDREG